MHAAAATEGSNNGAQKCLIRSRNDCPLGRSLICSSSRGSRVDRTGSQNLITRERLNQACANIKIVNHVFSLLLKSYISMRLRKPMAATIEGITKGIVSMDLMKD